MTAPMTQALITEIRHRASTMRITQFQLAKLAGVDHGGLWRLLNTDTRKMPSFETCARLMDALEISMEDLRGKQ